MFALEKIHGPSPILTLRSNSPNKPLTALHPRQSSSSFRFIISTHRRIVSTMSKIMCAASDD